jgi:hypothetical protein
MPAQKNDPNRRYFTGDDFHPKVRRYDTLIYGAVPKLEVVNLDFRKEMVLACAADKAFARDVYAMCSRDMLFWINTFVWTFSPKDFPACPNRPFNTWAFQDDGLDIIEKCIGSEDLIIEKSRDMGASWMILTVFIWRWLFRDLQTFLLVSRVEDLVDKKGDPDCLFWKLDHIMLNLPGWMLPNFTRTALTLTNHDNGSSIIGASTTGETGRGGRKTAIMLDEFAAVDVNEAYAMESATMSATNCRIYNSTPQGVGNCFHDIIAKGNVKKLRFHWTQHPLKSAGMYYDALGKPRSPWYDKECSRASHPAVIKQELDIDYLGSDYQFFESSMIDSLIRLDSRDAYRIADLEFNMTSCEPGELVDNPKGRLHLWIYTGASGKPPVNDQFTAGIDISAGTGATPSVISVANRKTGEKVAEWVDANTRPEEFAKVAVAVCRWFNNALMVPETNGGGGQNFMSRVWELGYHHVYFREDEDSITRKRSLIPGWHSTKETKHALYVEYRRALKDRHFINRSAIALRECHEIVFTKGGVQHVKSGKTVDPSGARENHADRPTADALCWKGMKYVANVPFENVQHGVPVGSLAWRREQAREKKEKALAW